jgi:hypothetical protein
MYQVQLATKFGVSASFEGQPTVSVPAALRAYPRRLASSLKAAGASDAKATGMTLIRDHGQPGIDFRISFTPSDGVSGKSAWFARAIVAKSGLVIFQTIAFPPHGQERSIAQLARRVQSRLVRSVRYP